MPFDRAACTGALLAWLIYAKFGMHQPIERIRRELNAQGGELASGTMTGWMERAAELLEPIVSAMKVELLSSPVIQTDGTGLRVLQPGVKQRPANSGQVAIYCTSRIALYGYSESKAGEHTEAFLRSAKGVLYKGTIVADAASTFDRLFVSGERLEAGCNAHGRRKFREAEAFEPVLAREGIRWVQALYRAEAAGVALGLDSAGLLAHRQREMAPIVAGFRVWIDHHLPRLLPKNPLRKVLQYYVNHWDALMRFLSDGRVPLDNNLSERLLRAVAIGRKNWLFAGSEAGARRACIFLSCVETCRLNGVDPYDWLCDVLDRVVPHPRNRGVLVVDLLPWVWKETREQPAGGGPSG
jgi:transposase